MIADYCEGFGNGNWELGDRLLHLPWDSSLNVRAGPRDQEGQGVMARWWSQSGISLMSARSVYVLDKIVQMPVLGLKNQCTLRGRVVKGVQVLIGGRLRGWILVEIILYSKGCSERVCKLCKLGLWTSFSVCD